MPYVTTYLSAKEMHEVEVFCEVNHVTSYEIAKMWLLEGVRSRKK